MYIHESLCQKVSIVTLRLLDTHFESLENLLIIYIVRKIFVAFMEFSNIDHVCIKRLNLIFLTKMVVAKTAVDRVW